MQNLFNMQKTSYSRNSYEGAYCPVFSLSGDIILFQVSHRIRGRTMQYHEGQQKYCSSYLAQKWQMLADQVFLFGMLEQLDRPVLQKVNDAAQAPWRPTRSCQLSTKVRVHVGICAPRHTSWTGSCDAPGASEVPHEWRLRYDRISVFSESDVQQSAGWIAVVGDEPHRHDSEHCCSSRFNSEWMRAQASLQHPSSTDTTAEDGCQCLTARVRESRRSASSLTINWSLAIMWTR